MSSKGAGTRGPRSFLGRPALPAPVLLPEAARCLLPGADALNARRHWLPVFPALGPQSRFPGEQGQRSPAAGGAAAPGQPAPRGGGGGQLLCGLLGSASWGQPRTPAVLACVQGAPMAGTETHSNQLSYQEGLLKAYKSVS